MTQGPETIEIAAGHLLPFDLIRYEGADLIVVRAEHTPDQPVLVCTVPAKDRTAAPSCVRFDPTQILRLVRAGAHV